MADATELDDLLAHYEPRLESPLAPRERFAEAVLALAFLAVAVALPFVVDSERQWSWGIVVALVLAYAAAGRVLVFVPLLFCAPLGAVPLLVALANVLSNAPEHLTRRRHGYKIALDLNDAWFAIGPVLVLAAADAQTPAWDDWPWYVLALLAQFAVDFVVACTREGLALGASPRMIARVLRWVWVVDALFAPAGLLAAFAAADEPYAFLLILPVPLALGIFAAERRRRLAQAVELREKTEELRRRELLQREALELNDNVVQHLVVAQYLLERGDGEEALGSVERSLGEAKRIIADLLHEPEPGAMRRGASPAP
jgi:hypothetical protein